LWAAISITQSPAITADNENEQTIRVSDLAPNASSEEQSSAMKAFQQGHIIRVIGGSREDVKRLLNVIVPEASTEVNPTPGVVDRAQKPPEPVMIAVRLTANGSIHQYLDFGSPGKGKDATEGDRFSQWVDRERARAKLSPDQDPTLLGTALGGPQPSAQAWIELMEITHNQDSGGGSIQVTVGVYRLVEVDTASDWYMIVSNPVAQPIFQGCQGPPSVRFCLGMTIGRTVSISPASGNNPILFDHGPTSTISSSSASFTIGGTLTPAGPGIVAQFSESWQQPSVTTTDQSDIPSGAARWQETFNIDDNSPPPSSTSTFLSYQGAIFEVPEDTTSFLVNVASETQFGHCVTVGPTDTRCSPDYVLSISSDLDISPPTFSLTPSQLKIQPGDQAQIQLKASIPSSTVGLPWTVSNIPSWLTVSQTSGSNSTTLTLSASPSVAPGTTASLNFQTDPPFAAPSVEQGPLVVTVTANTGKVSTSTILSSNNNPSTTGQPVTFQAQVKPVSGTGVPTGTVNFLDGGTLLASRDLVSGTASFTTSSLAAGTHAIVGAYLGDSNFSISTSGVLPQTVSNSCGVKVTPAVDLTINGSNDATVSFGDPVMFVARIHAASGYPWPNGSITISDSTNANTRYGSANVTKDPNSNDGLATLTNSGMATGNYTLEATYGGDNEGCYYNGARSNTVSLTVKERLGGRPPRPRLTVHASAGTRQGTVLPVSLTMTNSSSVIISGVTLNQIELRTLAGTGQASLVSPSVPAVAGGLAPGQSRVVTLELQVPLTVRKLSLNENGAVQDARGTAYQFSLGQVIFP
jgi:hypothetical protein